MIVNALVAILCTLVIAAGWYYLARSNAVDLLAAHESPLRNKTRRRLRRIGARAMIAVGISFFWLVIEVDRADNPESRSPMRTLIAFVLVMGSLFIMMVCVMVDLYLTNRIRQSDKRSK